MRAGRELRRAVMDRIIAQVPDLGGRVFDRATEDTDFPYVTMGPSSAVDASAECIIARTITLQIDVWHSRANKGVVEDLIDDIKLALHSYVADLESGNVQAEIEVGLLRVMDDPSEGVVHGVVQVETTIEEG
jgi:hypothetical protein